MKILILTQKIDKKDDVLGFMCGWIAEFAKHCEKVVAIALSAGDYELPSNVKVLSLGKERTSVSKNFIFRFCLAPFKKIKYLFNFYRYIFRERNNYEAVFIHMNAEYAVLGGWVWRMLGKKIGLWYAHGYAPLSLKIAEKLVNIIFTSTKSGCRLKSGKINVIGQGIDIEKFSAKSGPVFKEETNHRDFKIISIGRLSPSKDYETLIRAVEILKNKGINLKAEIIGGPVVETDKKYFNELCRLLEDKNLKEEIKFIGPIANEAIVGFLQNADLFANMGQTGSLDKAIVEAMACQLPILTCNEALEEVLGEEKEKLMYPKKDFKSLAERIEFIFNLPPEQYRALGLNLRNMVKEKHSLKGFINKIMELYGYGK